MTAVARTTLPGRLLILAGLLAAAGVIGCGPAGPGSPAPAGSVGSPVSGGSPGSTAPVGAGVRTQLAAALAAQHLVLADAKVAFRPAEPPELATVPRTVYQVQLRDDPSGGFIVAYDLASPQLAAAAGRSLAAYLTSGPGRVQSPLGTVHVIRQVGATLLYYRWLPAAAVDPLTPGIQAALETLGVGVPIAG